MKVTTAGWVGFGFATKAPNAMKDYDVVVGGDFAGSSKTLVVSRSCRISSVFELEMFVYLYLSVRETLFTSSENKTAPIINKEPNEETRDCLPLRKVSVLSVAVFVLLHYFHEFFQTAESPLRCFCML